MSTKRKKKDPRRAHAQPPTRGKCFGTCRILLHMPHAEAAGDFQQRLMEVWADHAIAGKNNATVLAVSAGKAASQAGCGAPMLWLFLAGHVRSFAWTQQQLYCNLMTRGISTLSATIWVQT